jgi:hypothetical protein
MDVDGYSFEGDPIQVKQLDSRNVVDNSETAM